MSSPPTIMSIPSSSIPTYTSVPNSGSDIITQSVLDRSKAIDIESSKKVQKCEELLLDPFIRLYSEIKCASSGPLTVSEGMLLATFQEGFSIIHKGLKMNDKLSTFAKCFEEFLSKFKQAEIEAKLD